MKKVTIYTTPTCHYCKLAKAFFNDHSVAYEEHDVQADLTAREEMLNKSNQMGVPVILVNEEVTIGFDEGRLRSLLAL